MLRRGLMRLQYSAWGLAFLRVQHVAGSTRDMACPDSPVPSPQWRIELLVAIRNLRRFLRSGFTSRANATGATVAQAGTDLAEPAKAIHAFSESENGVKLALDHKVSAQPGFQGNETRTRIGAGQAESLQSALVGEGVLVCVTGNISRVGAIRLWAAVDELQEKHPDLAWQFKARFEPGWWQKSLQVSWPSPRDATSVPQLEVEFPSDGLNAGEWIALLDLQIQGCQAKA
jgi:hypothetical protein